MGLGKTLQVIALVWTLMRQGPAVRLLCTVGLVQVAAIVLLLNQPLHLPAYSQLPSPESAAFNCHQLPGRSSSSRC